MKSILNIEFQEEKPGCLTVDQAESIDRWRKEARNDPALLCDLEGCGPVRDLELAFARLCHRRHALALSSGTAAIHAALLGCGVGTGDEVIVTPYSWPQSVAPVLSCGAVPVFADIDPDTLNLDPEAVQARLSPRTKVILPVHLFGNPADIERLQSLARRAGLPVIYDAAHALGARYGGRPVGAWGAAACFSFSRGKLVCAGEGGMLVTDDEELYARAVGLTQHPERARRFFGPRISVNPMGLNYRLHPVAAVLALAAIKTMTKRLAHRCAVKHRVNNALKDVRKIGRVAEGTRGRGAGYGIPLIWRDGAPRREFVKVCQEKGWPLRCGPVCLPLYAQMPFLRDSHPSHRPGSCPQAEDHCRHKELWALSALDIDGISVPEASEMAGALVRLAEE